MDKPAGIVSATQQVFQHHLYEYRKGVRPLFMMTMSVIAAERVVNALTNSSIDYHVHTVNDTKVNVFFGRPAMVEMVRRIVNKPLNHLSPQEDFILGILLGYDKEEQCRRFVARSKQ
ncbi:MAG: DUF2023 family protein [Alphaproteobacteria bacterium]|jgi:hypothetical protein|nr:DUF2023 family protein [Alphaproteobacteria bacterium]